MMTSVAQNLPPSLVYTKFFSTSGTIIIVHTVCLIHMSLGILFIFDVLGILGKFRLGGEIASLTYINMHA